MEHLEMEIGNRSANAHNVTGLIVIDYYENDRRIVQDVLDYAEPWYDAMYAWCAYGVANDNSVYHVA